MPDWLNHVAIQAPRNGSTSHSLTPSSSTVGTTALGTGTAAGSVAAGTLFTPTAGRLLLCFVEGAVTSSTPSGWTLPTNGSAVNNTGLYVWTKTAAGGDSLTTTHNGSNYPVVFDFYEFASGSTFVGAVTATGVNRSGGAGPTLSGLTGTNWTAGAGGQGLTAGDGAGSVTWSTGTAQTATTAAQGVTDGYTFGLTAVDANTAASASYAATFSSGTTVERLVVAVKVGAAVAIGRVRRVGKRR